MRKATTTGEGGPLTATNSVTITITPVNDLPELVLLAPADRASFVTNELITISGWVSDADDTNLAVEFLVDSEAVGSFTGAGTNRTTWSTRVEGDYLLTVRAKDALSEWVYSRTNTISVRAPGFYVIRIEDPQIGRGSFSLLVAGHTGQAYEIQSTTVLSQPSWTTAGYLTNITGKAVFTESLDANATKYYRAVLIR